MEYNKGWKNDNKQRNKNKRPFGNIPLPKRWTNKRFPKFKLLNSKLAAKLTENANIEKVAQKANVEPEKLINKIQKLIEENNTK